MGLECVGFNNLDVLDDDDRAAKRKTIASKRGGISGVGEEVQG